MKRLPRQRAIDRMRRRLLRRRAPRLEMALLVGAAASIGLLSSIGLLRLGLHAMWLRYIIAASAGYLSFLGLLWIWLPTKQDTSGGGPDPSDAADIVDLGDSVIDVVRLGAKHAASNLPAEAPVTGGDVGILDVDFGLDELVVVLAAVAAIVAGLVAAAYVVVIAPSFFAEILVDGALSYGLYRRVRGLRRQHWIKSAVSRTYVPFAAVVLFLALAGAAMQWYTPSADSIGDVWLSIR